MYFIVCFGYCLYLIDRYCKYILICNTFQHYWLLIWPHQMHTTTINVSSGMHRNLKTIQNTNSWQNKMELQTYSHIRRRNDCFISMIFSLITICVLFLKNIDVCIDRNDRQSVKYLFRQIVPFALLIPMYFSNYISM